MHSATSTTGTRHAQSAGCVRAKVRGLPIRCLHGEATESDSAGAVGRTVNVGYVRLVRGACCPAEPLGHHAGQLAGAGVLGAVGCVRSVAALDLEGVVAVLHHHVFPRHVAHDALAMRGPARVELDAGGLGAVDHGSAVDDNVLHRVGVGRAEAAYRETVAASASDSGDGNIIGTWFEGDAIIVVGHANIGQRNVSGSTDIPTICVLGRVGALADRRQGDLVVLDVAAPTSDRMEYIRRVLEQQVLNENILRVGDVE
jgi:hypothetical protein